MTTQSPNTPKRRTYSAEFKALLVKEAIDSGRSVASIAQEHGINQNLLHNWKRQYQRAHAQADTLPGAINRLDISPQLYHPFHLKLKRDNVHDL